MRNPLSVTRGAVVISPCRANRYPSELTLEGLRSFYCEVDRLASAAPQLRSLRVSVRGYASQP